MSIRVIARVRPQQETELEKDVIITSDTQGDASLLKIPNPKNENELYSFQFSGVYDQQASQQDIFDREISPTIKHLFSGFDVTIFAYGSTGTGKTHTMRGGKTLADRGVIPRLLSGTYRRARKIVKESDGSTSVKIALSYYEIYNDKVYDLFEAPEKRSAAGLPLRENNGKTIIVGLTERPCESLREFEQLYHEANLNRSTSATKLNAVSSRSHAILQLKLSVTTGDHIRTSVASAIDLAGSEDNRRTENGKERMVESASINKSLFTLAKCVEAISRGDERIPYRESKMTRILSLGQNSGLTIMILNLAPVRSYHLDTISSLNFANRTKKVEVREIENEPVFKGCSRPISTLSGVTLPRQPLRPLANTVHNATLQSANTAAKRADKQSKAFAVYSDQARLSNAPVRARQASQIRRSPPLKRTSDPFTASACRPAKRRTPFSIPIKPEPGMSKQAIEDIIERKVTDILASRALNQPSVAPQLEISEEVQSRLDMLEKKIEGKEEGREQGLTFLLMAKQHAARREFSSALRMYTLAKDFFPDNPKLDSKIERLQEKLRLKKCSGEQKLERELHESLSRGQSVGRRDADQDYEDLADEDEAADASDSATPRKGKGKKRTAAASEDGDDSEQSPRTQQLLEIINTRDVEQIRLLKGVGVKKADAMVETLGVACNDETGRTVAMTSLRDLRKMKGVGAKAVENMRVGLCG